MARVLLLASLPMALIMMLPFSSGTFFTQSPCAGGCTGGCGGAGAGGLPSHSGYDFMHHVNVGGCPEPALQPPCPVPPPPPVCPQHPPCPDAGPNYGPGASTGYANGAPGENTYATNGNHQSYADAVVEQFVSQPHPQQQNQQYSPHQQQYEQAPTHQQYNQNQYAQPPQQQQQYVQQQYSQPIQYAQYAQDVSGVNPAAQPTVIYLDQLTGGKTADVNGKRPQVVYQSLPTGGSRLIVPPGSDVYALNSGAGAGFQYDQPTVVYHTDQLPAAGGYATAAVEQDIDEMDLKGLEWGIPLKPTAQRKNALDDLEKLAENPELEEKILIRKARALADDVISREDQEEQNRDYGEMISSDEEVEMIGTERVGGEGEEELEAAPVKKAKKHHEKSKKSRRSSKRARAESDASADVERDNDLDRKKCNSRRLYEIMLENMNESSASSKRGINSVAEAEFGTSIDVICSRGHFSYVFSSNLYCEASKGHVTCIAFRQAPPTPTEE